MHDILFIEQAIEEGWLMVIRAMNTPFIMNLQPCITESIRNK